MLRSNSCGGYALAGGLALAVMGPLAAAQAQETVLHYFGGRQNGDAAGPVSALTPDQNGNLFGTSQKGGTGCNGKRSKGCGTVWEISSSGTESVVYSFTGGADGGFPVASVILDSSGNIYGTTQRGGANNLGTVFEVSPGGAETVLYSFAGGTDGALPASALYMDSSGNLYGTTEQGGGKNCFDAGCGVVYKIAPGGAETILYSFKGGNDGWFPVGNLIADSSGNLYGTTEYSGNTGKCSGTGCGTVFEITGVNKKKTLYSFTGGFPTGSDGGLPLAGLIMDSSGNLYGTTSSGGAGEGCYQGCGTVFELTAGGSESVLYSFQGWSAGQHVDGAFPVASLIMDGSGNLFGTTKLGGARCGCGTVFKVAPGGTETVLFSFNRGDGVGTTGHYAENSLIEDGSGNLYGTTYAGGYRQSGVAFEISQ